jgi:MFS superfamily sulfate permease-like transporter
MVTAIVAALFGSSMVMVPGPTTAISALLFATLEGIAVLGSARHIELALLLTLVVGLFQIIAGLARLGSLVSFVSHCLIVAFSAAALLIGISQIAGALGVEVERGGNVVERIAHIAAVATGLPRGFRPGMQVLVPLSFNASLNQSASWPRSAISRSVAGRLPGRAAERL